MRTDHQPPAQVFVVCVDGHSRHTTPFPNEAAASHWADTGHICHPRHWLSYTPIDNNTVSRWAAALALAGIDRRAAQSLTIDDRDARLGVSAWSSTEDNHWRAVLDHLDWPNHPQLL